MRISPTFFSLLLVGAVSCARPSTVEPEATLCPLTTQPTTLATSMPAAVIPQAIPESQPASAPAPVVEATPEEEEPAPWTPSQAIFTGQRMNGPFASLQDSCEDCKDLYTDAKRSQSIPSPTAPYLAVRILVPLPPRTEGQATETEAERTADEQEQRGGDFFLAVQTTEGWFTTELSSTPDSDDCWAGGCYFEDIVITKLELKDVIPGGAPEIIVHYQNLRTLDSHGGNTQYKESYDWMQVCGLGDSHVPSCTDSIPLAQNSSNETGAFWKDPEYPHSMARDGWKLTAAFLPSGELSLSANAKELKKGMMGNFDKAHSHEPFGAFQDKNVTATVRSLLGKHTIILP